eukprot:PITA_10747
MANFRFLVEVVLRILAVLCTAGGLVTVISTIFCIKRCPSYAFFVTGLVLLGIGAFLGLCIILFPICRAFWRRIKYPPPSSTSAVENFLREYAYQMPTRYSLFKVKKITDNFAERHRHSEAQFMNEVATIGHLHHVNLVRLLGYCYESLASALVYEYMPNGSLDKFLFAGREIGQLLTWEHLYSIALGAVRGIAYLHQDCDKRIIHFDLKPHNILLDADFTPKVSDFGLAKLCRRGDDHISMTAGRGTPGYVAPELCSSDMGPVTDKADVYSFGMLLLEIVGGRKNIDWKVSRSSQFYFPEWAFKLLETGDFGMRLRGGEMEAEDEEKAKRLTKIGGWCIQYNYRDRPSMARVVQMLEGNGDDVADPPMPCNSSSAATEIPTAPEIPLLSTTEESTSTSIEIAS